MNTLYKVVNGFDSISGAAFGGGGGGGGGNDRQAAAVKALTQNNAYNGVTPKVTRPSSPQAYSGDGAIDVILYGHDTASLNNASPSYMERYTECVKPARAQLAVDTAGSVSLALGGLATLPGVAVAWGKYSQSAAQCLTQTAP